MPWTFVHTPIGSLSIEGDSQFIRRIRINAAADQALTKLQPPRPLGVLGQTIDQLKQYFAGDREEFTVPLQPTEGTAFQQAVWRELQRIAFGQTISYGQLARRIGKPKAARAVGLANHHNPLPILIPCHRVIQADGTLGGYRGGLKIKQQLLDHERTVIGGVVESPTAMGCKALQ